MPDVDGYIFDLDGVLVDTAKYHYLAWKEIAKEFGFELTPEHNEQLKGIGREISLYKILSWAGKSLSEEVFAQTALRKNESYLQKISHIDHKELLPGVLPLLQQLKSKGKKIALGSASRNARLVLERTGILPYFDAIVDGTMVSKAKPDPEVFLKAAEALHLSADRCCVLEDAPAGIQAAKAAGMTAIGVGSPEILKGADKVISSLANG
ncbi:beta-phosphoglucomutase [Capnocytophaga leadbetteri]|uniref:beta-phosphoglucomutase n=1 Tax=Capnocytophaga leadbetteri TaxID=327575 RepID=UPI0026EADFEC|nr:beta-phosphoglucomutase [Capnocytophaga leadbetteri]